MTVLGTPMKKIALIVVGYTVTAMIRLFHGLRSVTSGPTVKTHQMRTPASTDAIVVDLNVPLETVFPNNGAVITSLIAGQQERT
ncbi:unnamed protein product, partial [Allacma fusca]